MPSIRVMIFGLGKVGSVAAGYLLDKNLQIVAAFSRCRYVGLDLGTALGRSAVGITVKSSRQGGIKQGAADVALFFTTGLLDDLLGDAKACLEAGINVLTVSEGALYPWRYDPVVTAELDRAGKRGGASVTGTGVTDGVMVHMSAVLAACAPSMQGIEIDCVGDFGRLGPAALAGLPLGKEPMEFMATFDALTLPGATPPASIGGQVAEALAALLGMTTTNISTAIACEVAKEDITIPAIQRTIRTGTIAGLTETILLATAERVTIKVRLSAKVFESGDQEYQSCTIKGAIPMTMRISPLPGVEITAATAISRLSDVIAAPPGFQSIDRMRAPLWLRPVVHPPKLS